MGLSLRRLGLRAGLVTLRRRTLFYRSNHWTSHRRYRLRRDLLRLPGHHRAHSSSTQKTDIYWPSWWHVRYCLGRGSIARRGLHGYAELEMVFLHQSTGGVDYAGYHSSLLKHFGWEQKAIKPQSQIAPH